MKRWVEKLVQQFDMDLSDSATDGRVLHGLTEDRATLLFVIDTYNKHLLDVAGHPVRKIRETLDEFAKEMVEPKAGNLERVFFRFRQFFATYRIDECAYYQKTFEEFRTIIWDFIDQLAVEVNAEQKDDLEIKQSLDLLKEAVESNSIESLKNQSRKFIDSYMEKQYRKQKRTNQKMKGIRKNLNSVKKQLETANDGLRLDHLTQAFNRKSFDEFVEQHWKLYQADRHPVSMIVLDIDYFKRINDTYGHQVGDFVLKDLVKTLHDLFPREADLIARIGGEEFAIVVPDFQIEHAVKKSEEVLAKFQAETFVHEEHQIKCTVSIGIAQLCPSESAGDWIGRADKALYQSKNNGRNRLTVAAAPLHRVA